MIQAKSQNTHRQIQEKAFSPYVEYVYYATVLYGNMSVAWGISIPNLAAGMLAALSAYCVLWFGHDVRRLLAPIALPLGCALSFLLIQITVYDQSPLDFALRSFISWIFGLLIIQALAFRPGFLRRFSFALLGLQVLLIPYLKSLNYGELSRAGLDAAVGLANPNDLAGWFGFSVVYFSVAGISTRRNVLRTTYFFIALFSLFVVGLTVSRGALFAIAISVLIAFRRLLKGMFFPVVALLGILWIAYETGLFDDILALYMQRGTEETGRFLIWPAAIERFLTSPWIGVGVFDIGTYIPEHGHDATPHNSFIYIGLASGLIPLMFFIAYWIKAAISALRTAPGLSEDAQFCLPLLVFTLLQSIAGDDPFKKPWAIVALTVSIGLHARRLIRPLKTAHSSPRRLNFSQPRWRRPITKIKPRTKTFG